MQAIRRGLVRGFNLDQLRAFMDVAELGSFTAAAERTGLTQPAVSLQVKHLEQHLGVRLIERIGRKAQPTPAGHELLRHGRRIEKEVIDASESMAPHKAAAVGRVRIGTGATACIHLLPPVIAKIKGSMPGLEIVVRVGNTEDILRDLEANSLDLALVTLPASGRSLEVEPIYDDELVAIAPASESHDDATSVDAAFLGSRSLLLFEGGNTRRLTDDWFGASGVRVRQAMEFGSVEAIKQLVGAGLGWSLIPRLALRQSEGTATFRTFHLRPALTRALALVVRRDKHLSRGLRETMQAIRDEVTG
ncbi:LysR family transcriptional regulator [Ensifer adhaerens]|nr:LysR family transcriptional regulator [Ensifer adhaerens]